MCVRGVRGASVCGVCVYVCVCMCVCVCVCVCLCLCVRTEVVILRMLVYPFGFEQLPAREKVFVNICVTPKKKIGIIIRFTDPFIIIVMCAYVRVSGITGLDCEHLKHLCHQF